MRNILALALTVSAGPVLAAEGPFFSLANTDFVVLIAFILFIAVLFYFKVPGMLGGMLDKRAEGIQSELDEARALREEAQTLLASYERKQKEMQEQASKIVAAAKEEAAAAAEQAKEDLKTSIARRMTAAEDQISLSPSSAVMSFAMTSRAAAIATVIA